MEKLNEEDLQKMKEKALELEDSFLTILKEEWIRYMFLIFSLFGSKSKLLVSLVKNVLNEDKTEQFLKFLNATEEDLPILRYFSTGLWRRKR